jgi:uncharacterized cupredoxin-like copper-binding protein
MRLRWFIALFSAALLMVACGGGDGGAGSAGDNRNGHDMGDGMDSMEGHGGDDRIDFGRPGDSADADRKREVAALDSLEFDPPQMEVAAGEVVTFVVTNDGKDIHEFTLGDVDFQISHEDEMPAEGMMEDRPYSITIEPGQAKELTWSFTEAGEVLYGCHQPGHYEGGMVGAITVS